MTDNYFVRVDNHKDLRTAALESSKFTVQSSQSYYRLLDLRNQKKELYATLKDQLVSLSELGKELVDVLPYHELAKKVVEKKPTPKKQSSTKNSSTKKKTATKETPVKGQELDKLNDALAKIEEKLHSLA